jgi:hypothetical protein
VGDEEAFTSKVKLFLDNPAHLAQAKKDARAEAERYGSEPVTLLEDTFWYNIRC